MVKLFTYFHTTGRGISHEMRSAIKRKEAEGLKGFKLTSPQPRLCYRNIRTHLQEARYDDFFDKARNVFNYNRICVQRVGYDGNGNKTSKDQSNDEKPVVAKTQSSEENIPETVEKPAYYGLIPEEAEERVGKSRDADLYVYVKGNCGNEFRETIKSLAEATSETGNRIRIYGVTINEIPFEYEERFDIVSVPVFDFSDIRGIVTDCITTALKSISSGVPVHLYGDVPENFEPFVTSDIQKLNTAKVPGKEERQKFLDNLFEESRQLSPANR